MTVFCFNGIIFVNQFIMLIYVSVLITDGYFTNSKVIIKILAKLKRFR